MCAMQCGNSRRMARSSCIGLATHIEPVMAKTLYGWDKKIPTTQLWHHKCCGQCGNIPGYPVSLLWLQNKLRHRVSRRDRPDALHRVELPRLGHRQSRKPRRGLPAELPSGLCVGERRRASTRRLLLSARALRHVLRKLQGSPQLSAAIVEAAREREKNPRQARSSGRRQAADSRRGRALLGMGARHAPRDRRSIR